MIAILSSMADSSAPTISPIKSPKWSRDLDSPETVIPDSQGSSLQETKNISDRGRQNHPESTCYAGNQTSQMQTVIFLLQVLREHTKNSTCPYGLQYRLRPHAPAVQFDREFQTTLDQIGRLAHVELLMLMMKQQKKYLHVHVTANNKAIQAQQQLLQDMYQDQQSSQATRNLAANRARLGPRT